MIVTLLAEGREWQQWQSFSIVKTLDRAQHDFTFTTTDEYQEGLETWNVKGGTLVSILFDGALVLSGYVKTYSVGVTDSSHSITVTGSSKAADVVESSHLGPLFWKNTTAESIIEEVIAPFGFDVTIANNLDPIGEKGFRVAAETTAFQIIKKLAERNGLLIYTDNLSNFVISDMTQQYQFTKIVRGDWLTVNSKHDMTNAFSTIVVKGQNNTRKDGKAHQTILNTIDNSFMGRYRPLVVVESGEPENQAKLTQYINRRLNGDAITATVTVKSAYDRFNRLWGVGQRVWLDEPIIDVNQELMINEVEFSLSVNNWFAVQLGMKAPDTYTIDPVKASNARRSTGAFSALQKGFL